MALIRKNYFVKITSALEAGGKENWIDLNIVYSPRLDLLNLLENNFNKAGTNFNEIREIEYYYLPKSDPSKAMTTIPKIDIFPPGQDTDFDYQEGDIDIAAEVSSPYKRNEFITMIKIYKVGELYYLKEGNNTISYGLGTDFSFTKWGIEIIKSGEHFTIKNLMIRPDLHVQYYVNTDKAMSARAIPDEGFNPDVVLLDKDVADARRLQESMERNGYRVKEFDDESKAIGFCAKNPNRIKFVLISGDHVNKVITAVEIRRVNRRSLIGILSNASPDDLTGGPTWQDLSKRKLLNNVSVTNIRKSEDLIKEFKHSRPPDGEKGINERKLKAPSNIELYRKFVNDKDIRTRIVAWLVTLLWKDHISSRELEQLTREYKTGRFSKKTMGIASLVDSYLTQAGFDSEHRRGVGERMVLNILNLSIRPLRQAELQDPTMSPRDGTHAVGARPFGGIDFNPAQMTMQVKKEGNDFKFNFNGKEINAAQVTGATFTINTMTPITDLPKLLGLNQG